MRVSPEVRLIVVTIVISERLRVLDGVAVCPLKLRTMPHSIAAEEQGDSVLTMGGEG